MSETQLPQALAGVAVHMVGIKGTGMCALAEILIGRDATVTGSDTEEVFYTDAILRSLGIPYTEGFARDNVPEDADLVVYSAAYRPDSHPELRAAREMGIPILVYTDALGELSRHVFSVAVAGAHGKSSTTALAGSIVRALELPGTVLVGCAVRDFGNRSTLVRGDSFFVAETCEYRRHFLAFHPSVVVITSVEVDHLDYFSGRDDYELAFCELTDRLSSGGVLIYCADDEGARRVAAHVEQSRPDVRRIPYGRTAEGRYRLESYEASAGRAEFRLSGCDEPFVLHLPGEHLATNATAAMALADVLSVRFGAGAADRPTVRDALARFSGLTRRSEVVGRSGGILFMDDYGHHPTEIRKTLRGLRDFYAPRRIIVDFMSHTFTRTDAMLSEFAHAFGDADEVILHQIYASARERYDGSIDGVDLVRAVESNHPSVRYFESVMAAAPYLEKHLTAGDLFVTMGAGSNWQLSHALYKDLSS